MFLHLNRNQGLQNPFTIQTLFDIKLKAFEAPNFTRLKI